MLVPEPQMNLMLVANLPHWLVDDEQRRRFDELYRQLSAWGVVVVMLHDEDDDLTHAKRLEPAVHLAMNGECDLSVLRQRLIPTDDLAIIVGIGNPDDHQLFNEVDLLAINNGARPDAVPVPSFHVDGEGAAMWEQSVAEMTRTFDIVIRKRKLKLRERR